MPSYTSYIGRLRSPDFFWDDIPDSKFRLGNSPAKVIPEQYGNLGYSPLFIEQWSKEHGLEAKQIDWGGWGMEATKADLQLIWNDNRDYLPWGKDTWQTISEQIGKLSDDQKYVLVVIENA